MTPYELNLSAKGYRKRSENTTKESIYQAFLISRWVWQKKVDIDKILQLDKKKEIMTDQQMLERVKQLNRVFCGEIKEGEEVK